MCGEEKRLCKAHLAPRALKKTVYNDDGQENFMYSVPLDKPGKKKVQNLIFDNEILCSKCDNSLGRFDKELIEFTVNWSKFSQKNSIIPSDNRIHFEEIPANTTKLYYGLLAILLRHSFSKRFGDVSLGEEYENELNQLFLQAHCTDFSNSFSIKIFGHTNRNIRTKILANHPFLFKPGGRFIYGIMLPYLSILINVGRGKWRTGYEEFASLSVNNDTISVPLIPYEMSIHRIAIQDMINSRITHAPNRFSI